MDYRAGHAKALDKTGKAVIVYLDTRLSKIVDSPVKSLDRNTAYKIGDAVSINSLPKPGYLICTAAGTTAVSVNADYKGATEGSIITDGSASFKVKFLDQSMSKADVVIASKEEAEAGTDNSKLVTPLRVKEAVSAQTADYEGIAVGDVVYRPYLKAGYVKANGATVNRADYPRLVQFATDNNLWTNTPTEEPWKFGQGNGSSTMVLPNYVGRFIQGGDNVGKLEAGLPNIIATWGKGDKFDNGGDNGLYDWADGAAERWEVKDRCTSRIGNSFQLGHGISFNASRSNSIYGASSTVQPPSITLIPQIRY